MVFTPFEFAALPPEVNSFRLSAGPGPTPMVATSAGYKTLGVTFSGTAQSAEASITSMEMTWQGLSGERAATAFRGHSRWLQREAEAAIESAKCASGIAKANMQARATMPPLSVIQANRAVSAALATATAQGGPLAVATGAVLAANELIYMAMWTAAAASMTTYSASTAGFLAQLPAVIPPPPIVDPSALGDVTPYSSLLSPGTPPGTETLGGPGGGQGVGPSAPTGGQSVPTGGQSGPTGGQSGPTSQAPGPSSQPVPDAQNALSNVDQAIQSLPDPLAEGAGMGNYGEGFSEQSGFPGTSTESPTLAAMSGGAGSAVAMGLMRGGFGAMSGASTGFRMPSNWPAGVGTAFGAPAQATGAPPARTAPRRGVTAPTARMRRRRRDDEEERKSKVFVPGEPVEVPVLDKPLVVGVIEYADSEDERDSESARIVNVAAGVIGVDDELEGAESASSKRPR